MINKLSNLVLVVTTTIGLAAVEVNPAQAAYFGFSFGFGGQVSEGYGELFFENSKLKGIGTEKASLSELQSGDPQNFSFYYDVFFYRNNQTIENLFFDGGNPLFTFESGELKGIEFSDGKDASLDTGNPNEPGSFLGFRLGLLLSLMGNQYQSSISGVEFFVSQDGYELVVRDVNVTDEGPIEFVTYEPVEAIPEPLTLLGAGAAIGFGTFFKRQLVKKSQKSGF